MKSKLLTFVITIEITRKGNLVIKSNQKVSYTCKVCGSKFLTYEGLGGHCQKKHRNMKKDN